MTAIKFGTDGWRAIIAKEFTVDNLTRVAEATALWLKRHHASPSVMIGHDCRFGGPLFLRTVANVMAHHGVKVFIPQGFVSTPMVSLAVNKRQVNAGIVITASHNPPDYSGYKIKGYYGGPATPDMIAEVEALIPEVAASYEDKFDQFVQTPLIDYFDMEALYITHLKQSFDLNTIRESGLRIGYDAMFGAGQSAFRKVMPQACLLHAEYNPSFLGTAPEPLEKNLGEFMQVIRSEKLDVGLATDGDADRIGLFDENGNFVDSHHILLLLVHYLHTVKGLSGKVAITFSVTPKVAKLARLYNLPVEITPVGFKYLCEIMLKENVMVAGEESGGIAVTGHVPERDGIYIGLMIMEMMAQSGRRLTELIEEVYGIVGPFSFQRRDLHLTEDEKQRIMAKIKAGGISALGKYPVLKVEDMDGYKFHLPEEQWLMVRASGTEPVLRIYAESATREGAEAVLDAAIATLRS
jgi:phosphomannomutase